MPGPLISAIMPTHNYGQYIEDAIDSILKQTYHHFELIIVDDASTDNTQDLIHKFKDDRIIYLKRNECSCSGVVARNDGMAIAKGDLIAVTDADDINLPDRFERQVEFFKQHQEIDLLGCGIIEVDTKGTPISDPITRPQFKKPEMYRQALLNYKNVLIHPTLMFRKYILERISGYNDFVSSGDTEFMIRASRYFRFYNLNDVLVFYRKHGQSITKTYGDKLRKHHYPIFLLREYLWDQKEIERLQAESFQ